MTLYPRTRPALLASAFALACALSASASFAADHQGKTPENLRGTITAVSDHGFSVESTRDGKTHKVTLDDHTRLAGVTPSSLDAIREGTFIGTANAPGGNGQPSRALEVVVFPESMKGTGEGDYPWDTPRGHDQHGASGGKMGGAGSGSAMTNGTVSQADNGKMGGAGGGSSMTNGTVSQTDSGKMGGAGGGSAMTNGTVSSTGSDKTAASGDQGMMTLTVNYGDGSKQIMVPRDVPVVAVQKATMADIKKGEAVFVAGDLSASPVPAKVVIVGLDGTIPPM